MDLSPAYCQTVATFLPKAKIVFDRFPVMKLFNEKRSDLRREAADVMQKKVLEGLRWLLLKAVENLSEGEEKKKPAEALVLSRSLAVAYDLKEDLGQFWEQAGKKFATLFLDGWIKGAEGSGTKKLQEMAKTLAAHRSGPLTYDDVMINSGPMEGINNKIKTMKRQAYRVRNREFFKLKILTIHESRCKHVG